MEVGHFQLRGSARRGIPGAQWFCRCWTIVFSLDNGILEMIWEVHSVPHLIPGRILGWQGGMAIKDDSSTSAAR